MDEKNIQLVIQHLEKELADRLEKLWKVFSWSSSILISIAGGIIVLTKNETVKFDSTELFLISLIIGILTLYAWLWIRENLELEGIIRDQLEDIFVNKIKYPLIKKLRPDRAKFGYKVVVLLLGATALLATWLSAYKLG